MAEIILKNLTKIYSGDVPAVKDINLKINDGEFIVFLGPSGCGKSTTLRMIAGLETISDGEILIDNKIVNDVDSAKRDLAIVFQNYALYPHMSIMGNLSFGLKLRKFLKSTVATSAIPIGIPGCPEFAFSTASIDKNLIALDKSLCSLLNYYPI